jgi:hypothetical protein
MTVISEPPLIGDPQQKAKIKMPRLGEELPVFCERCGYSLHGLPQTTCAHCAILQFHCPECGHHQPINTLRPAVQTVLGRLRALALVAAVVGKLAFFAILSIAWFGMGIEWMHERNDGAYFQTAQGYVQVAPRQTPLALRHVDLERMVAFGIFAFAYGCAARMLLLRWRRGPLVGASVAVLVLTAVSLGASVEYWDSLDDQFPMPHPYRGGFFFLLAYTALILICAATVVWPIWCGLVNAFLPRRAATVLLDWQRSMSNPHASEHIRSALAREPIHAER